MNDMDLSDLDRDYDGAEADSGRDFDPLPDGTYQVVVDEVELVWTKDRTRRMLKWTLRIISYPHEGRMVWKWNGIERDKLGWLKRDLAICGLTLDRLSELPRRLGSLLDVCLEVNVKTNKRDDREYQNCYFRKKLQLNGIDDVPPPADEDAPF